MFKLVTWNINSIRMRLDRLVGYLGAYQPDLVCLQETKCTDDQFPVDALRDAGYESHFCGEKSYNGVAFLAPVGRKLDVLARKLPTMADAGCRYIEADIDGIHFGSVYAPNGKAVDSEAFGKKLAWFSALRDHVAGKADQPVILAGDFNIAPSDTDCYDPKVVEGGLLVSKPEREAFNQLLNLGLKDTFRELNPDQAGFSWWDYRQLAFPKNRGFRIDLILASHHLLSDCRRVFVERDQRKGQKPSDHAPVCAEFEF